MTAVLTEPGELTGYEDEELIEPAVPCSILFRDIKKDVMSNCPRPTVWDAFVTCENRHERTQHYCAICYDRALKGDINCRVCRLDMNMEPHTCPVVVLASVERKQK